MVRDSLWKLYVDYALFLNARTLMCYIMEDGEERGSVNCSNFNIGTERTGCKFRNWGDLIAEMAELFIDLCLVCFMFYSWFLTT